MMEQHCEAMHVVDALMSRRDACCIVASDAISFYMVAPCTGVLVAYDLLFSLCFTWQDRAQASRLFSREAPKKKGAYMGTYGYASRHIQ